MSQNDSFVVIGERRTLPGSGPGSGLRNRTSDSTTGSDSGCLTPPATGPASSVEVDLTASTVRNRYGTPGCMVSMYNNTPSGTPSVFDQDVTSQSPYRKKMEETINIDSGFGVNFSSSTKAKARNSSSASELWDSVLATPVANLKNKLKKRPSFVDEDQKWNLDTERILGGIIFCLIIVSFMMAGFITYAAFRGPKVEDDFSNGKYDSMKYALSQSKEQPPAPAVKELVVEKDFLLKDDVSIEEVLEYKRILEDEYGNQEVFIEEDIIYQDIYSPEARPYAVKDVVKPVETVDAERASKSILEEAEKLLEEETRLLKDVSNRLESFVSNSRMISNDINQIFDDDYVHENNKGEDFQYVDEDHMGQNFEVFPKKEHFEVVDDVDEVDKDTDSSEVEKSSEEADNTRQAQASIKVKPPKTRNRNPLTKSVKVQKMSKPKKTSETDVSMPEVGELTTVEEVREPEADGQEVEDYEKDIDLEEYENEYVDYVESGEDRVKRSRFGRDKQKTKIMRFRKYKNDNKNDDKNDFYLRNNDNDKVRRRKAKINGGNDY